jgi:hypothetical protein
MTRLTDEQIDREWDGTYSAHRVRAFAHRIAALAVAEYRSREVANLLAQLAERENLLTAVMESRAETEAQLAEQKEYFNRCDERRNELAGECQMLRAQLAEVTKERDELAETSNHNARLHYEQAERACHAEAQLAKVTKERDFYRLDAERHAQFADSYRAQLSSDKREALVPCRECAGSGLVPATPSGDYTQAELDCRGCSGPCGQCATPSPEAREVPSEAVILRIIITPADAKRIMAMAKVRP